LTRTSAEPAFRKTFKDRKGIDFVKMDAQEMTFADASFDTVCIANSLHHVAGLRRVLAEMTRVLRPKGRFIVAEMYCDGQTDPQMTHVLLHHWWAQPR
jgi:ubiquinone/menaquinone biosynthesis C-methylase UbiE